MTCPVRHSFEEEVGNGKNTSHNDPLFLGDGMFGQERNGGEPQRDYRHVRKHADEAVAGIRGCRSGRKGSLEPGPGDRTLPDSTVTQRTDPGCVVFCGYNESNRRCLVVVELFSCHAFCTSTFVYAQF